MDENNSEMVFDAIEFAAEAHRGQYRKCGRVPYLFHSMDVGRLLVDIGCSDEIVAAAILHDTVEDTAVTLADIARNFGEEVARLVAGVSEPENVISWEVRKTHTIRHLKTVSEDILYIICADKFDNVRSIRLDYEKMGEGVWDLFSRPKDDQRWYYQTIAEVLESRISKGPLLSLLNRYKKEITKVF